MSADATELEITLVIRAADPARVVAQLEGLTHLGAHELRGPSTGVLHDRYFDLPGGDLRVIGFALRLREREGRWSLCLKGGSRHRGLAVERAEVEGDPVDRALVERMAFELGSRPFDATGSHGRAARAIASLGTIDLVSDPVAALGNAGWTSIQDRLTLRRTRAVMATGPSARSIAQLAIDTVTYVVAGAPLQHHEVEIEAAPGTDATQLAELAQLLQAVSPAALHPWRPSKLRTGGALAALAARLGPAGLASPAGDLLPGTYTLIEAELSRSP